MGRSLQRYILDGLRTLHGRNPQRAPRISSHPNQQLTFYHFYPVAERGVNRPNPAGRDWAREQPEIAARNTATQNPHRAKTESKAPLN